MTRGDRLELGLKSGAALDEIRADPQPRVVPSLRDAPRSRLFRPLEAFRNHESGADLLAIVLLVLAAAFGLHCLVLHCDQKRLPGERREPPGEHPEAHGPRLIIHPARAVR